MPSNRKTIWSFAMAFFIFVILILSASELAKSATASALGYKTIYRPFLGKSIYSSKEMNVRRDSIMKAYDFDDSFFETNKDYLAYQQERNRNIAIIQWSGRLFLILLSVFGYRQFRKRRTQRSDFTLKDWIWLLFSLSFMKDACSDLIGMAFTGMEYETWLALSLPAQSVWFSVAISLGVLVFIIYLLPRRIIRLLIVCGIIGGSAGALVWYNAMSVLFPSSYTHKAIQKGQQVKDFNAIIHGSEKQFEFGIYKDSLVVLDFMFSTCAPCRYSIPHINKLHKKYRPRGVMFFAVDPIEKDWMRLSRFLEAVKLDYPILKIKTDVSDRIFGVRAFPTIIVVNKGKVILLSGGNESSVPKIEAAIVSALQN